MLPARSSFLAWLSTIALVACAKGDPIGPTGAGTGSGASSSEGGSGQGGTNGNGGAPSTGGEGGTITTGPSCEEQPCKLVTPQCGCDAGLACSLDANGDRACVEAGSAAEGQPCSDTNLCAAGTICVGYSQSSLACSKFCETNSECAPPGGRCVITLDGADGVLLCSDNCNLVGGTGCGAAGTSCQLGVTMTDEPFTFCGLPGAGVEQALCTDSGDCAPGFACLGTTEMPPQNRCFQWCDTASPSCNPNFPNCTALQIADGVPLMLGATTYGACNP